MENGQEFIARRKSRVNPGFFQSASYNGPFRSVSVGNGAISIKNGIVVGSTYQQTVDSTVSAGSEVQVDIPLDEGIGDFYIYGFAYAKVLVLAINVVSGYTVSERDVYPLTSLDPEPISGVDTWVYKFPIARVYVESETVKTVEQLQFGDHRISGVIA